jgi:phosphoglucosamine mutase
MANLGLDKALREAGVRMVTTQVGDRYVLEEMLRIGANLGGEQSGHLLFLDHATTGDGIGSALHLLSVMRESGETLSELATCMAKFPQVLVNVRVREKRPFDAIPGLRDHVGQFEADVKGAGRILLRYSGTESLARIMLEGEDQAHIERVASDLAAVIRGEIGA